MNFPIDEIKTLSPLVLTHVGGNVTLHPIGTSRNVFATVIRHLTVTLKKFDEP